MVDRVIDPGAEPPKPHSLEWLLDMCRRNNGMDLKTNEVMLLVQEIDRLTAELADRERQWEDWASENGNHRDEGGMLEHP